MVRGHPASERAQAGAAGRRGDKGGGNRTKGDRLYTGLACLLVTISLAPPPSALSRLTSAHAPALPPWMGPVDAAAAEEGTSRCVLREHMLECIRDGSSLRLRGGGGADGADGTVAGRGGGGRAKGGPPARGQRGRGDGAGRGGGRKMRGRERERTREGGGGREREREKFIDNQEVTEGR
jgi:hypothetical protein